MNKTINKRGRPTFSIVRNNIIEMIKEEGEDYGYNIYLKYNKKYPKVALRSIYYNLHKAIELGLLNKRIVKATGKFSWGDELTRCMFSLNEAMKPELVH